VRGGGSGMPVGEKPGKNCSQWERGGGKGMTVILARVKDGGGGRVVAAKKKDASNGKKPRGWRES